MTLLAAFEVLLLRNSGQDDIIVGSLVAGRNRSDIEGLIGFFVNTLVFRTDLSGDPTFRALLERVRDVAIGAYAHQDLPFERLVEELNPQRTLSHSPLFQVMARMEDAAATAPRLAGTSVSSLALATETAKFDLIASFEEKGDAMRVSFRYSKDLFEASAIRHLLTQFQNLLKGIAADPDRPISSISLLSVEERSALTSRGNRVRPTNPFIEFSREDIEQSIWARFDQQARRYPSRIAVRARTGQWTYDQLARKQIARPGPF